MLYPAELRRHNTYIIPKKKGLAPYFSFLKDLNEKNLFTLFSIKIKCDSFVKVYSFIEYFYITFYF